MGRYIIKRCLWMIVILLGAAFVIFTILYFTPGDPAVTILGANATAAEYNQLRETMGLNRSYIAQLGDFFYNTFIKFDFGDSWTYNVPVMQEMMNRLPRTLIIGICSMILNLAIGIPLGIFAATNAGKWQDSVTMAIAMVFVSAPNFWVALMMIVLFSLKLGWLPAYGIEGPLNYIMPIIASSLGGIAVNARQTRSSMLEVIRSDFVTTARSKGQREKVITYKHMLPNALMPIITSVGMGFARIVAGSAVIEQVFSVPGVGQYMLAGINGRDYPVVRGCVLFFAAFTAIAMLLVDLAYAFVDPRIKAQYSKGGKK